MAGQRTRVKVGNKTHSGSYERGYSPGFLDIAVKEVTGHYPSSQKTTIRDKDGNRHTGKRVN